MRKRDSTSVIGVPLVSAVCWDGHVALMRKRFSASVIGGPLVSAVCWGGRVALVSVAAVFL